MPDPDKTHVQVGSTDSNQATTHNVNVPPAYYAIIGRGVAAWYNHLTLLYGDSERLSCGGRHPPVVHIGFKEPWKFRENERMGQWPRMLNFFAGITDGTEIPKLGLKEADLEGDGRNWLRSAAFAESLEEVEGYIARKCYPHFLPEDDPEAGKKALACAKDSRLEEGGPFLRIVDGFVGTIQTRGTPELEYGAIEKSLRKDAGCPPEDKDEKWLVQECRYRIPVFRKVDEQVEVEYIYALAVDVCTGVSSARLPRVKEKTEAQKVVHRAFNSLATPPDVMRKKYGDLPVVDGNTFIGSPNQGDEVVAVVKSGAVSAQAVQSALDMPSLENAAGEVWWVSNDFFSRQKALHTNLVASQTVPGARNQLEIRGATEELVGPPDGFDKEELLGMGKGSTTEVRQQRKELEVHFGNGNNQYFAEMAKAPSSLVRRLFNLSHHDMCGLEIRDGQVKLSLAPAIPRAVHKAAEEKREEKRVAALKQSREYGTASIGAIYRNHKLTPEEVNLEFGPDGMVSSFSVDKLVYSSGQDYAREGTPAKITRCLGKPHFRTSFEGWPMFVSFGLGAVRVLGGAMVPMLTGKAKEMHASHFKTLPAEAPAAAGGGINPALINIRRANKFQYDKVKLNSASVRELKTTGGLSASSAEAIVALRQLSVRGYTKDGYATELEKRADTLEGDAKRQPQTDKGQRDRTAMEREYKAIRSDLAKKKLDKYQF